METIGEEMIERRRDGTEETGRVKAREGGRRRVRKRGGRRGRDKKFDTPVHWAPSTFPATRRDGGTLGRAALNRFRRVIAIPPLRFYATFVATSANLPLFSRSPSAIASLFRPASRKILQSYKKNKEINKRTYILCTFAIICQ